MQRIRGVRHRGTSCRPSLAALLCAGRLGATPAGAGAARRRARPSTRAGRSTTGGSDPPSRPTSVDWEARVSALLREQPGDVVVTAVGDMIFNQQISHAARAAPPAAPAPHAGGRHRLRQPRVLAQRPPRAAAAVLQLPGPDPEFVWELAAIGINLVSMANNHALDFGPEGLERLPARRSTARTSATPAPGSTLAAARAPGDASGCRARRRASRCSRTCATGPRGTAAPTRPRRAWRRSTRPRSWSPGRTARSRRSRARWRPTSPRWRTTSSWPSGHHDVVMVSLHNHDRSHHRAYGIQDTTPAERRDHVPARHRRRRRPRARQRAARPARHRDLQGQADLLQPLATSSTSTGPPTRSRSTSSTSATARSSGRPTSRCGTAATRSETFEGVMVRMTFNAEKLTRIELIPVTIDDEGPLYGVPRLASEQAGPGDHRADAAAVGRPTAPRSSARAGTPRSSCPAALARSLPVGEQPGGGRRPAGSAAAPGRASSAAGGVGQAAAGRTASSCRMTADERHPGAGDSRGSRCRRSCRRFARSQAVAITSRSPRCTCAGVERLGGVAGLVVGPARSSCRRSRIEAARRHGRSRGQSLPPWRPSVRSNVRVPGPASRPAKRRVQLRNVVRERQTRVDEVGRVELPPSSLAGPER